MVGLVWADHNLDCIAKWVGDAEGSDERVFEEARSVAIHFSNVGTLSKSGSSLGVAAATAVVASFLEGCYDLVLKIGTAMTGEINLRGQLLQVADIPVKIRTAKRLGCARVIIPEANRSDLEGLLSSGLEDDLRQWIEQHVFMAKDMVDVLGCVIEGELYAP